MDSDVTSHALLDQLPPLLIRTFGCRLQLGLKWFGCGSQGSDGFIGLKNKVPIFINVAIVHCSATHKCKTPLQLAPSPPCRPFCEHAAAIMKDPPTPLVDHLTSYQAGSCAASGPALQGSVITSSLKLSEP